MAALNRVATGAGYRAQPAASAQTPMGGSCLDLVYGELGCTHSYAVELPPSLPAGGLLGATLLGALRGDPRRWKKEGMNPAAAVAVEAGAEMAAGSEGKS